LLADRGDIRGGFEKAVDTPLQDFGDGVGFGLSIEQVADNLGQLVALGVQDQVIDALA